MGNKRTRSFLPFFYVYSGRSPGDVASTLLRTSECTEYVASHALDAQRTGTAPSANAMLVECRRLMCAIKKAGKTSTAGGMLWLLMCWLCAGATEEECTRALPIGMLLDAVLCERKDDAVDMAQLAAEMPPPVVVDGVDGVVRVSSPPELGMRRTASSRLACSKWPSAKDANAARYLSLKRDAASLRGPSSYIHSSAGEEVGDSEEEDASLDTSNTVVGLVNTPP